MSYQSMTDDQAALDLVSRISNEFGGSSDRVHGAVHSLILSAFTSIRNGAIAEERERICDILMEEAREYAESDPESTDQMIASSLAKISSAIRFRSDPEKDSNGPTEERAHLIAAAPAMAEALKPFVEWIDDLDLQFADHDDDIIAAGFDKVVTFGDLRRSRAALLLAHGGKE